MMERDMLGRPLTGGDQSTGFYFKGTGRGNATRKEDTGREDPGQEDSCQGDH